MDDQTRGIVESVFNFASRSFFTEKMNRIQIEGQWLYTSEIHLMLLIAEGQNSNITGISKKLNVTKGALSQTIHRLVGKGMLRTEKDPFNQNEMTLYFTDRGHEALQLIRVKKKKKEDLIVTALQSMDREKKETLHDFMKDIVRIFSPDST